MLGEDSLEYAELLQALWNHYQPVGRAEELEVERITLCWWKHKRTWRYENSANLRSRFSAEERLEEIEGNCKKQNSEDETIILELRNAEEQLQDTGKLPEEIKQKLFTMRPACEDLWQFYSSRAEAELNNASYLKIIRGLDPEGRVAFINLTTLKALIMFMEKVPAIRSRELLELATAEHVVPNADNLDKLIRYEAATDRNLGRSVDRLEHLQRQRRGSSVT